MSATLATLLATPLPRGMRCDGCRRWERICAESGECEEHDRLTAPHQGCVYWSPLPGIPLDYMGIPLASPLADG